MRIYDALAIGFFAEHDALGYTAAALLAFGLGILVTVFCFRIRKHKEEEKDDRKP